jgi:hypothetical protein
MIRKENPLTRSETSRVVWQRRRLQADPARLSHETTAEIGVPFVTEDTLYAIKQVYNLPYDHSILTPENIRSESAYLRGLTIAENYFSHFPNQNRSGLAVHYGGFFRDFYEGEVDQTELRSAMVGIGYTLKALHLQLGPALLDALEATDPKDLAQAVQNSLGGVKVRDKQNPFVLATKNKIAFPDYQVFLQEGLDLLKVPTPCEPCLEDGAVSMYNTLNTLWPGISQRMHEVRSKKE